MAKLCLQVVTISLHPRAYAVYSCSGGGPALTFPLRVAAPSRDRLKLPRKLVLREVQLVRGDQCLDLEHLREKAEP